MRAKRLLIALQSFAGAVLIAASSCLSWMVYGPLHGQHDTLYYIVSDVLLFSGLGLVFHAVHLWRNR